jgi:hypothetical protein
MMLEAVPAEEQSVLQEFERRRRFDNRRLGPVRSSRTCQLHCR